MGESRTILTEEVVVGKESPLDGGCYYVVANRLVAYGGFSSDEISVRIIDNHFVIVNRQVWSNERLEELLGVVDCDKPELADERMYEAAKKIAKRRAKRDKNTVIDITSRAESMPEEAEFYVSTYWGGRVNYWTQKIKLDQKKTARISR